MSFSIDTTGAPQEEFVPRPAIGYVENWPNLAITWRRPR